VQAEFAVDDAVGVSHVAIVDDDGAVLRQPPRDQPFAVQARIVADHRIAGLDMGVYLLATDGTALLNEIWSDQPGLPELIPERGRYLARIRIPPVLPAGDYVIGLWLGTEHVNFFDREVLRFSLLPDPGDRHEALGRRRMIQPPVTWSRERIGGAPA
jgi:hypothetical protein